MIVLDTSAVIAILSGTPDGERLAEELAYDGKPCMSMVTFAECLAVARTRADMEGALERWLALNHVAYVNLDESIARRAAEAFTRYSATAGLNLTDCFAYALATALNVPLLFTGDAFAKTDVKVG